VGGGFKFQSHDIPNMDQRLSPRLSKTRILVAFLTYMVWMVSLRAVNYRLPKCTVTDRRLCSDMQGGILKSRVTVSACHWFSFDI